MNLQAIERHQSLSRADFLEHFYTKRPVIVENATNNAWDLAYISAAVGNAKVMVNIYKGDKSDYHEVSLKPTTMRDFIGNVNIRELLRRVTKQSKDSAIYLFNHPSCVFARNESRPELHTGWGAHINSDLSPLWKNFKFPTFIHPEDFAFAMIIIGSSENATRYHFDHGGAAKALAQISGVKRVIVCAPNEATHFNLNPMYTSTPMKNITTGQKSLEKSSANGFEGEIKPGDVLYWPSFWFHEIRNVGDDANIAVGLSLAEVKAHPLLHRHFSGEIFRKLMALLPSDEMMTKEWKTIFEKAAEVKVVHGNYQTTLLDIFQKYEKMILSDLVSQKKSLLEWNNI